MADSKLTALDALTAVDPADLLYVVDDPSGTAASKKATVGDVIRPLLPAFPWVAGQYYRGFTTITSWTPSAGHIAGKTTAYPIWLPYATAIDRLGVTVLTAQTDATMLCGIYLPDATNNLPGTREVYTTANLDCSTTGDKVETVSITLPAGLHWAVVRVGAVAGVVTRNGSAAQQLPSIEEYRGWIYATSGGGIEADLSASTWGSESNISHGVMMRAA